MQIRSCAFLCPSQHLWSRKTSESRLSGLTVTLSRALGAEVTASLRLQMEVDLRSRPKDEEEKRLQLKSQTRSQEMAPVVPACCLCPLWHSGTRP